MDGVAVQVLGPPQPYLENRARNENSIVLKLTYGETSFLFTGDAEDDQEAHLVETYGSQLQADILKAGHHGSKTSTGGALLDAVDPSAVIISSAYDSRYGHPSTETLERLDARSIPTYWTGVHGDTVLVSDGTDIELRTQRGATTKPLSLRDEAAITPGSTGPVETRMQIAGGGDPVTIQDTATPDETVVADGAVSLELAAVNADAEGDDRDNLADEYIVLTNNGSQAISMGGWTVSDAAGRSYSIPDGFTLDPGASVMIHTGSGSDSETDLCWGSGTPIWNNDGDTVIVRASDGTIVLEESY
jgi:competence protein ComEC